MDSKIRYGQLISALSNRSRQSKATLFLPFPDFWSPYPHQLRIPHLCPQFCYKNNKSFVRVKQNGYFLYRGGMQSSVRLIQSARWVTYINITHLRKEASLGEKTRLDILWLQVRRYWAKWCDLIWSSQYVTMKAVQFTIYTFSYFYHIV